MQGEQKCGASMKHNKKYRGGVSHDGVNPLQFLHLSACNEEALGLNEI